MKRFIERHLERMFAVPSLPWSRLIIELLITCTIAGRPPGRPAEQVLEKIRIPTLSAKQLFKFLGADRPIGVTLVGI